MTHNVEPWVVAWLALMAEWSIRWGVIIAALAVWLAVRPPRRASIRYLLCLALVGAGILLPLTPRWGGGVIPRASTIVAETAVIEEAPASEPVIEAPSFVTPAIEHIADPPAHPEPIAEPPPMPAPLSAWSIAAFFAAGVWLIVVVAMLIRTAGGWWTLARLRREAERQNPESERLLDACRSALGLSRTVRIASHRSVVTPAVVGGFRPVVLVPDDWNDWPEERRRACLLHELSHLSRYDDWARLFQELLRAPFFFHPMVRWLLARLDREREILCDEAAVALGSDPVDYARLLLDLARRPGRLRRSASLPRPGWLPFLDRRTVAVRIARLLEDDMPRTLSRPSAVRSFAIVGAAIAAALLLGGLRVHAGAEEPPPPDKPKSPAPVEKTAGEIKGVILDPDRKPVDGATILVGLNDSSRPGHQVLTTDAQGRFTWRPASQDEAYCLIVYKEGLAAADMLVIPSRLSPPDDLKLRLGKAVPFVAVLNDEAGKAIAGAKVQVAMIAATFKQGNQRGMSYSYIRRGVIAGSPLEKVFVTTTGADGGFTFGAMGPLSGLQLAITTADGRAMRLKPRSNVAGAMRRMLEDASFVTATPGETTRLVAIPGARVEGRVITKLSGVPVSGLKVYYQESRDPNRRGRSGNHGETVATDANGRFVFDGLGEGRINIVVGGDGENKEWTYRAAEGVELVPGKTAEVTIELIRGVEVEGTVIAEATDSPVEGASVGVYGPYRPRSSAMTRSAKTDARGHYHYRLPPGETYFYVMGPPKGFIRLEDRTVTIPEGVSTFTVPPMAMAPAVTVHGRIVDANGHPIEGAKVVGNCEGGVCRPFGMDTVTDAYGAFQLPTGMYNTVEVGKAAQLLIRLADGAEHEVAAVPDKDGSVVLKLPVLSALMKGLEGPKDVAPGELAGLVVDPSGKPIGGVEVDAWTWYPGNEAKTNTKGLFRIKNLDKERKVEVVVRKDGYTPQLFLMQPTGQPGWVIVLDRKTYFEGKVTGPDGKPVPHARIRANHGPKMADGVRITEIWTEATTDEDGHYRMYAQADVYDIQVRVPKVGVARLEKTAIGTDEAKPLDIALTPGVTFRARVVNSLDNEPVAGVRLWNWQHRDIEGRSKDDGLVEIPDMMPGPFRFQVDASGYARWWSEQASNEWSKRQIDTSRGGWQRNFDMLEFELRPGMPAVTITVEPAVTINGQIVDPDGHPVVGATVAPALTGTGNSITGDTRFSFATDRNGRFTMRLPASGEREYNLVAHDGKFQQWRQWANGVLPPIRTEPGEVINDVEMRLTRPATVRGRVLDADGHPVANREVRASAADRLQNRYYDPTVRTNSDGTFELKFIRPGEQFIQVAPFWLDARHAPEGTSRTLTLKEGESRDGVDFWVPREER